MVVIDKIGVAMKTLREYLIDAGYAYDIALDIEDIYCKKGIEGAVAWYKFADSEQHDNSGELRGHIDTWHREYMEKVTPKCCKDMYMDDVGIIALAAFDQIEGRLKKFGITLTPEQQDWFYVPIWEKLEKFSNGDYRSYN